MASSRRSELIRRLRRLAPALVVAALLLGASTAAGLASVGRPFPSFFVDPYGDYSVVFRPHWGTERLGLALHDHVTPAEGAGSDSARAEALDEAVQRAVRDGQRTVTLRVRHEGRARTFEAPIRFLSASDVFWFQGLYVLMALLLLWSAAATYLVAGRRPAARAYLALGAVGFVFLTTFLDYHFTRWFPSLFAASTLGNALTILAVAWCFPTPVPSRVGGAVARGLLAAGCVIALVLAAGPFLDVELRVLRVMTSGAVPLALLVLAATVVLRLRSARGHARQELRAASWGLVIPPCLAGVGFIVMWSLNAPAFHLLLPFVALAIPASIGYAIIRHNLLGVDAILTRRVLAVPLVLLALVVGGITWALAREADLNGEAVPLAFGGALALATLAAGATWITRWLFQARARFQPTIEQLSDELAQAHDVARIRERIGALVTEFLPASRVDVLGVTDIPARLPDDDAELLRRGRPAWTREDPLRRLLYVPMRSGGELQGAVVVSPKHGHALFTDDEVRLVQTIASLGALAMSNAEMLEELEARRSLELGATRGDKELVVDVLAAEIAHELAYPLGFLRHFLRQVEQGRASEEAMLVGRDEVARLQRMLAWIRRLQIPRPSLRDVVLADVVERTLVVLGRDLERRSQRCHVEVDAQLRVVADPDPLLQLLLNLLRNASDAAGEAGALGIRTRARDADVAIEVWNAGPAIEEDVAGRIFNPWFTTRPDGSGLGLAVVQRVARSFRWTVEHVHRDGITSFLVVARRSSGGSS